MKYQFSILKNLFFKKYLKWFIIYLFFMLIEIYIVTSTPDANTKKEAILMLLSLVPFSELGILEKLFLIFNIVLTIYIVYTFFIYEYNNSFEFIFLRINHLKRNINKLVILLLFIFVIRSVNYFLIYFFFPNNEIFNFFTYLKTVSYFLVFSIFLFSCFLVKKYLVN